MKRKPLAAALALAALLIAISIGATCYMFHPQPGCHTATL